MVLQNAWQLHKEYLEKFMGFLEFRRHEPTHYLETYGQLAESGRKGKQSRKHKLDSRYNGKKHILSSKKSRYAAPYAIRTVPFDAKSAVCRYM